MHNECIYNGDLLTLMDRVQWVMTCAEQQLNLHPLKVGGCAL